MSIVLLGSTSGSCTLQEQAVAGSTTLTLPTITGTVGLLVSGTAVTCAGQTSIDFTGLPAGVRRITVMLAGVSTSGTSIIQTQIGAGSFSTSGYNSMTSVITTTASTTAGNVTTTGFGLGAPSAATVSEAVMVLTLLSSNQWVASGWSFTNANRQNNTAGSIALGGTLDRVRVTTVNGTDTFDTTPSAGSINILYE